MLTAPMTIWVSISLRLHFTLMLHFMDSAQTTTYSVYAINTYYTVILINVIRVSP